MRKLALYFVLITSLSLTVSPILATNGMNMTAYGARYAGMGGAVLAVGGSVMDLESNPAHLARLKNSQFEGGSAFMMPHLTYRDTFIDRETDLNYTNTVRSKNSVFPLPYLGYESPLGDRMGWGIAFYAQGGMGAQFDGIVRQTPGLETTPGNFAPDTLTHLIRMKTGDARDTVPYIGDLKLMKENTYSNFGFARLTPGLAIRFGKFSIGAGLDLGLAKMEWRWTFSDPLGVMEMPGAGYRYKSDPGYSVSGKVGVVYELNENWRVAYAYKALTKMNMNGDISINAGDPNYFRKLDTSMSMKWPEAHRTGIAYTKGGLTLGLDVEYVKWASAMSTVNFRIPYPWVQTPLGNYIGDLAFSLKWRDQTIVAVGMEYKPNNIAFRLGYNYGRSPVDGQGLNPMFPAIAEHHVSAGTGITVGALDVDFALEYALPAKVSGSDMSDWDMFHAFYGLNLDGFKNPYFNHSVTMNQFTPHLGVTYKF